MSGLQHRQSARRGDTLRQRLEQAVERAIAALDAYDGDANVEPWLGAPERASYDSRPAWGRGAGDDREEECEDEGAQCEDEGSYPDGDDELSLCGIFFGIGRDDDREIDLQAVEP